MNIEVVGQRGAPARVPPFSREEFDRRLARVQDEIVARGLDFLVVTTPEDVYYLTGFHTIGYVITPQWLVLGVNIEPTLVVRAGERSNADGHSWVQKIVPYGEGAGAIGVTRDLTASGGTIGLDINCRFITLRTARDLEAMAGGRAVDASDVVLTIRRVKSEEELRQVEKAARTSDAAMQGALETVAEGVSDREVAAAMNARVILSGSAYISLPMAVSAGSETAYMHNIDPARIYFDFYWFCAMVCHEH
ncbi:MAG: aminopeptidase P family N-terminal domain-containing protein [Rhizobium sp.]